MSSVYNTFNSMELLEGVVFGGAKRRISRVVKEAASASSGSSSSSSTPSNNNSSSSLASSGSTFSGPAKESEDRKTGNSNALMNAQGQLENPDKPAGQKLFSQFNSDIPGGHSDRNKGAVQAEFVTEAWSNSSNEDKAVLVTGTIALSNPVSIASAVTVMVARELDQE